MLQSLLQSLRRLVDDDTDLRALTRLLGRFNVFDALGVARAEIRHSNFLAWLLDPRESHANGPAFLKPFLADIIEKSHSKLKSESIDFTKIEVRREWKNIDLLVVCSEPKIVLSIENKIDSIEHSEQLQRYRDIVTARFPDHEKLFVFLTTRGDRGSDSHWTSYSYEDVLRVLSNCPSSLDSATSADVCIVLDHYLRLLRSWFMDDPEIDQLCRKIYRDHRQALDVIYRRINAPPIHLMDTFEQFLSARADLYTYRLTKEVGFVPMDWLPSLPNDLDVTGHDDWKSIDKRAWISFYISIHATGARWHLWLGPTKDRSLSQKALDLLTADPTIGLRRPKLRGSEINVDLVIEEFIEWESGLEPDSSTARSACERALAEIQQRFISIPTLLKPVFTNTMPRIH